MPKSASAHDKTWAGPALLVLICLSVGALGYVTYASYGGRSAFAIATGAMAVTAMSLTLILATRPRILEPLFGGLDKMYQVHKWLGISALVLMLSHEWLEPDFDSSAQETEMGDLASEVGEIALNAFIVLVLISWLRRLPLLKIEVPYQIWRFSHRFMGVFFALTVFHLFFVDVPAQINPLLSIVLNIFGIAGIAAWIYVEFIAPNFRRRTYVVSQIDPQAGASLVTLMPRGPALNWRPGQFAFLRSSQARLSEPHPFTIASAPRPDGALQVAIRALGDWTRQVPSALKVGMDVEVEGPYGRFDFRKGKGKANQLWLAGGIGITPFLAWAETLAADEPRQVHLIYCVRNAEEVVGLEVLEAAAARAPNFSFQIVETARDGRLTADRTIELTPFPIGEADLWFCGPTPLKDAILKGLKAQNQTPRKVQYEHFEFA